MFRLLSRSGTAAAGGLIASVLAACASYPMPVQRMADAEAAARTAQETGAAASPQAQLHLKLAQEEIAQAKQLTQDGDNRRADFVLVRAKSDAELALAEVRAQEAQAGAQRASQKLADVQANGGNAPTSTTTTTSATTTAPPTHTTSTTITTTTQGGKP